MCLFATDTYTGWQRCSSITEQCLQGLWIKMIRIAGGSCMDTCLNTERIAGPAAQARQAAASHQSRNHGYPAKKKNCPELHSTARRSPALRPASPAYRGWTAARPCALIKRAGRPGASPLQLGTGCHTGTVQYTPGTSRSSRMTHAPCRLRRAGSPSGT